MRQLLKDVLCFTGMCFLISFCGSFMDHYGDYLIEQIAIHNEWSLLRRIATSAGSFTLNLFGSTIYVISFMAGVIWAGLKIGLYVLRKNI